MISVAEESGYMTAQSKLWFGVVVRPRTLHCAFVWASFAVSQSLLGYEIT